MIDKAISTTILILSCYALVAVAVLLWMYKKK